MVENLILGPTVLKLKSTIAEILLVLEERLYL